MTMAKFMLPLLLCFVIFPTQLFHLDTTMPTKMKRGFKVILGSQSMARRRILAEMGFNFTIVTADINEKAIRTDTAEDLVVALAEAKIYDVITYKVVRGLTLEHPLVSPFVDFVVGEIDTAMGLSKNLTEQFANNLL